MHYFPITFPFLIALGALALFLIILIEIGILGYAYERIGVRREYVFSILILTILGSYINIPVAKLPAESVHSDQIIQFFGMRYVVPMVQGWRSTVIAVNLGGAVVPFILSLYLFLKNKIYWKGLLAVTVVTVVVHQLAYPVPGVGIAEPSFVPPLWAAGIALLISRQYAPQLAYISGTLGTLIGADLMNLDKIEGLGAPVASIGGARTFDGIFVTGIFAVLLAALMGPRRRAPQINNP